MSDPRRLELLHEHRRCRRNVHQLLRELERLRDQLDLAVEASAEAEELLAVALLQDGPMEHEGRRYEHETRDGCDCVRVSPVDAYLLEPSKPQ